MIPPVTPGAAGGWQRERPRREDDKPEKRFQREEELVLWQLAMDGEAAEDARPPRLRIAMYELSQIPEWAFDPPGSRIDVKA